jgi:hypothetical protein
MRTRNVKTEDCKFFSLRTVELVDWKVVHLIAMLGRWIYRVSFGWEELV